MEQILEVFGIDWKILLVQVVNFVVLLVVLRLVLYKPLIAFLEKRRTHIIEGVAQAERAEAALKDAGVKKAAMITEATLEAEGLIANARERAKTQEAELVKAAQEKTERILSEAARVAEEEKRQALKESEAEIARLIVLGAEKAMRK